MHSIFTHIKSKITQLAYTPFHFFYKRYTWCAYVMRIHIPTHISFPRILYSYISFISISGCINNIIYILFYSNAEIVTSTVTTTKFVICDYQSSSFSNFRKYISANHSWYSPLFQVPDATFVLLKGKYKITELIQRYMTRLLVVIKSYIKAHLLIFIHSYTYTHKH